MRIIRATILRSPGDFSTYIEDFPGVYGTGATLDEAKDDLKLSMALYAKHNADAPKWLKKGTYRLSYRFDMQSTLKYYRSIFRMPAIEKLTGLNKKQIVAYTAGKGIHATQAHKIEAAFRKLGGQLRAVKF